MKRGNRSHVTPRQAAQAHTMRREMTEPERKLWKAIRARLPIESTHFRRQVPIGPYIVDFCSHGLMLIVEVDGDQHGFENNRVRDNRRTAFLNEQGYRVLRFSNRDVMIELDTVLDTIFAAQPRPTPYASPQGGGEMSCRAH
jgi:very-short-patch-repair endonuclease